MVPQKVSGRPYLIQLSKMHGVGRVKFQKTTSLYMCKGCIASSDWNFFPVKLQSTENRSSHQKCSMKKGVLRNFTKFTGKHLCRSLFFNKVAGLRPATLLKKRL